MNNYLYKILIQTQIISCSLSCAFCSAIVDKDAEWQTPKRADLIVYSYDRPMQLFALLESVEMFVTGLDKIYIILRTSNNRFKEAYNVAAQTFPDIIFINQSTATNLEENFRTITLECITSSPSAYLLFAVDDNIVTDHVNISECIEALESNNSYAFYLRLGKNINYSYPHQKKSTVPPLAPISKNRYTWFFRDGTGEWNYPNNVDMTLYRKSDLEILAKLHFTNPNTLEGLWAQHGKFLKNRCGVCYEHSKIINIPLNKVQTTFNNRSMNSFTPDELLHLFEQGLKIDIERLIGIDNHSPHIEYEPTFILRAQ